MKLHLPFLALLLLICACNADNEKRIDPLLLPYPNEVASDFGGISVLNQFTVNALSPELEPLAAMVNPGKDLLIGHHYKDEEPPVYLSLSIDPALDEEAYILNTTDQPSITGGSYNAVAMGVTTLLQSITDEGTLPRMTIKDQPDYSYRSLMLDVARSYYSPESIKSAIDLCRWYKLNYLQLHLTDDSAFTFPSTAYPKLATKGHSYTLEELATVSMGREDTYDALQTLIQEIAEAFPHSPYIHIGGDEAFFAGMDNDPATVAYMKKNDLPDVHELFRHFLIRLNDMVRAEGRTRDSDQRYCDGLAGHLSPSEGPARRRTTDH